MPLVTFEPTDVNLNLPFERQPNLSYRVRIDEEFDYIELSTREESSQLNGFINVYLETGDNRLDSPYYERFLTTVGKRRQKTAKPNRVKKTVGKSSAP